MEQAQRTGSGGDLAAIPLPPLFYQVDRNLKNLAEMKIDLIRWFLLGNGNMYGPAPTRRLRYETSMAPYWDYEFSPPSRLDRRFARDLRELLERIKKAKVQIIPSLLNFEIGGNVGVTEGPRANTGARGRADIFRVPEKRDLFLNTVLKELLAASKGYEQQIFAWEVINEPIWLCMDVGPLSTDDWVPRRPEVTLKQMTDFLSRAVKMINDAGFPSTIGHRYLDDFNVFPVAGVTRPQFHFYNERGKAAALVKRPTDPAALSKEPFSATPKPILGEFDSAHNRFGAAWDALGNDDSTLARLKHLETQGCDVAIIWPDLGDAKKGRVDTNTIAAEKKLEFDTDKIKVLEDTRREIVTYTGGKLPPSSD